jgi:tryptophan synthase beta chain
MSGRGEKDIFITSPRFRKDEWRQFLTDELRLLDEGGC